MQDWGVVDAELRMIYMTPTTPPPPQSNTGDCFEYNYKGLCSNSNCFLHIDALNAFYCYT